jgi:hypothetical protein
MSSLSSAGAPVYPGQEIAISMFASWVHGNALTAESPEHLAQIGHHGWGADVHVKPGRGCWFHIPLPTPVIVDNARVRLQRVFVLFKSDPGAGEIRNLHVYDGAAKPQEFNDLHLSGEHRHGLDCTNWFELTTPHPVEWGIGISFFFQATIGFAQTPPARLIVASAGADYVV